MLEPLIDKINLLYKHGTVKTFANVMNLVTKTELARALGSSTKTISRKVDDTRLFTVGDVIDMAKVFGMTPQEVFGLILAGE